MAQLDIYISWTLHVSNPELVLIRAALAGRVDVDKTRAAKELDDKLSAQVLSITRDRMQVLDGLERSMQKAKEI